MSLTADDFVHASRADAISALRRVGAAHDPRLDLKAEVQGIGAIHRIYGIFGNVVELEGQVEDPVVVHRLLPMVKDIDNERMYGKLQSGRMAYTPVNKRVVRRLGIELLEAGLHLPWTWRPMNFDFAALISDTHRKSPLPFLVFYSEQANIIGGAVSTSRVFSLPIEGLAQGTWAEPIQDDLLDPDIGLVIEANYRA